MPERDERDEHHDVVQWRYSQARQFGVPADDAITISESTADIEQLRRLIADGCDPVTAARILL